MPLDVELLNENKVDEMCTIMKGIHKYILNAVHSVCYEGEEGAVDEEFFQGMLFGGDQLIVCRSRAAQAARCSDDEAIDRLDGVTSVTEDWHAGLTLMRVWCLCDLLQYMNFLMLLLVHVGICL